MAIAPIKFASCGSLILLKSASYGSFHEVAEVAEAAEVADAAEVAEVAEAPPCPLLQPGQGSQ